MKKMGNAGIQNATGAGRNPAEGFSLSYVPPLPQAGRDAVSGNERRQTLLTRTIEAEIIPRLLLSGRAANLPKSEPADLAADVESFSRMILADDEGAAVVFVMALHDTGTDAGSLFLDLLTPAARLLGELWEDDRLSFAEVTIGVGRLQRVMNELSHKLQSNLGPAEPVRRILLVPAMGEQHRFGIAMLSEFFRSAQWDVASERPRSRDDLCRMLAEDWFDVIGFSAARIESLDTLAAEIRAARRASKNQSIGVMVGGPAFLANPDRVAKVGADATASDGRQAVVQAQGLLTLLPRRT